MKLIQKLKLIFFLSLYLILLKTNTLKVNLLFSLPKDDFLPVNFVFHPDVFKAKKQKIFVLLSDSLKVFDLKGKLLRKIDFLSSPYGFDIQDDRIFVLNKKGKELLLIQRFTRKKLKFPSEIYYADAIRYSNKLLFLGGKVKDKKNFNKYKLIWAYSLNEQKIVNSFAPIVETSAYCAYRFFNKFHWCFWKGKIFISFLARPKLINVQINGKIIFDKDLASLRIFNYRGKETDPMKVRRGAGGGCATFSLKFYCNGIVANENGIFYITPKNLLKFDLQGNLLKVYHLIDSQGRKLILRKITYSDGNFYLLAYPEKKKITKIGVYQLEEEKI